MSGATRRDRLLELMELRGLGSLVLRRPENFARYACGGDNRVEYVSPEGVADVVVTPERECVLVNHGSQSEETFLLTDFGAELIAGATAGSAERDRCNGGPAAATTAAGAAPAADAQTPRRRHA